MQDYVLVFIIDSHLNPSCFDESYGSFDRQQLVVAVWKIADGSRVSLRLGKSNGFLLYRKEGPAIYKKLWSLNQK
jgi:hypothetical protein